MPAGRIGRPVGSTKQNAPNVAGSVRLRQIAVRTISRAAARVSDGVGINDNVRVRATTDSLDKFGERVGLRGGGPVALSCRQGQKGAGRVPLRSAVFGAEESAEGIDGFEACHSGAPPLGSLVSRGPVVAVADRPAATFTDRPAEVGGDGFPAGAGGTKLGRRR
jgi:hypothetical protein